MTETKLSVVRLQHSADTAWDFASRADEERSEAVKERSEAVKKLREAKDVERRQAMELKAMREEVASLRIQYAALHMFLNDERKMHAHDELEIADVVNDLQSQLHEQRHKECANRLILAVTREKGKQEQGPSSKGKRSWSTAAKMAAKSTLSKDVIRELSKSLHEADLEIKRLRANVEEANQAAMRANLRAAEHQTVDDIVHNLAAEHFQGHVEVEDIEAKLERDLDLNSFAGALEELREPINMSCMIYDAARKKLENDPGFEQLLDLPELRSEDVCQESNDFETLYGQAAKAQAKMKNSIAAEWHTPDKDHPNNEEPKAGLQNEWVEGAVSPGVKGRDRAKEKLQVDYDGKAEQLMDLARMSLKYEDCRKMVDAVKTKMGENGMQIVMMKNRFANPTVLGYSDLNTRVKLQLETGGKDSGHSTYIAEVQLNHPHMLRAKEEAHKHYEVCRSKLPKIYEKRVGSKKLDFKVFEAEIVKHVKDMSPVDYATAILHDKVSSVKDTLQLWKRLRGRKLDLGELAKLEPAPDKAAELRELKEHPSTPSIDTKDKLPAVGELQQSDPKKVKAALKQLKSASAEEREPFEAEICALLLSDDKEVCKSAVKVLGGMINDTHIAHIATLIGLLNQSYTKLEPNLTVIKTLSKLPQSYRKEATFAVSYTHLTLPTKA